MRWLPIVLLIAPGLAVAQERPRETRVPLAPGKESARAIEFRPPGAGPFPAVVVLHGDFGLNEWIRIQARRLAEKGYLVLAVDLYRGELPQTVEDAHILERGLPEQQVLGDIRAAVDYLEKSADVRKGALGILGWDCGGGYALDAALRDRRLKTVVLCYGRITTDPRRLATLEGNVLALFGGKDEGIAPATIAQFRAAMQKAGKTAAVHVYPQCGNSFMDPTSPYFEGPPDRAAIADAWAKIEANLQQRLQP